MYNLHLKKDPYKEVEILHAVLSKKQIFNPKQKKIKKNMPFESVYIEILKNGNGIICNLDLESFSIL
jgi:hypothetical protein